MVSISGALLHAPVASVTSTDVIEDDVNLKMQQSKRGALERRDLDTQVDCELKERFCEYSYIDTDVRMLDCMTLRMEIRLHNFRELQERQIVTATLWNNLRAKWARVYSPESLLRVKVPGEAVDTALMSALDKARTRNTKIRSSAPLISWLCTAKTAPNQKTVVGLFRCDEMVPPLEVEARFQR